MQLTNKTWQVLIAKGENTNNSRNVFVLKRHYPKWQELKRSHEGNYYLTSILRAIYGLNALAGGRTGLAKSLSLQGATINYQLDGDGDVLIHGLYIDSSVAPAGGKQATGLYRTEYIEKAWKVKDSNAPHMDLAHRWNNAHYAAVSGKFDDKKAAGRKLIDHIQQAYKAAISEKDTRKNKNHYSLYWQNGKHNCDRQRDHLVSLIQQAQTQKAPVNWLVHGEGAGTFVRAMQVLESYPSLSRFEAKDEQIVRNLREATAGQKVYFSNPRGKNTNQAELEKLCKKVGFTYVGTNINRYDLFAEDARKMAVKESAKLVSKLALGGAGALGSTNALKSWELASNASTIATTVGLLLAGYVVSRDAGSTLSGYIRNLPRGWHNTLGKGNESWN